MNPNEQLTITLTAAERAALLELLRRVTLQGDEALTYVQVKARIDAAEPVRNEPLRDEPIQAKSKRAATSNPSAKDAPHGQ